MGLGTDARAGSEGTEEATPWVGQTWAYAMVIDGTFGEALVARLNEMGSRGWEAVGMSVVIPTTRVLLKRPQAPADEDEQTVQT